MAEVREKYVYDDSLSPGRSGDAGWSQLPFDGEGKLKDHAVSVPDEDGGDDAEDDVSNPDTEDFSPDKTAEALEAVIGVVVVVAAAVLAAPHVRR
jgi:hypothetical protein